MKKLLNMHQLFLIKKLELFQMQKATLVDISTARDYS